jgi:hypothetical protein
MPKASIAVIAQYASDFICFVVVVYHQRPVATTYYALMRSSFYLY